jgi:RNA polymerase sigma-70 factor (ECF subfamily)
MSAFRFLTDKELLRSENSEAFREFYNRYWKVLYHKALIRLGNEEDAKDMLQDIFIGIWKNRMRIVIDENATPYLFTALKYAILKKIERDHTIGKIHPLNFDNIENLEITHEELVHLKQMEKAINNAIDQLPKRMKEVYQLSRQKYLKNKEIAAQLNISEQTVKNILSEAMKRLRKLLADYQYFFIMIFLEIF